MKVLELPRRRTSPYPGIVVEIALLLPAAPLRRRIRRFALEAVRPPRLGCVASLVVAQSGIADVQTGLQGLCSRRNPSPGRGLPSSRGGEYLRRARHHNNNREIIMSTPGPMQIVRFRICSKLLGSGWDAAASNFLEGSEVVHYVSFFCC